MTYGERDGTNDVYATIALRQYTAPKTPVLAISGASAQTSRDASTGAASTRTYTVQTGDTLSGISRKFYGTSSLAYRLAAANSKIIKHPNLIYPGQVLTIPPKDELPPAMQVSASVKTANNTTTTRTATSSTDRSQDKRWKMQLAKEQAAMR